MKKAQIGTLDLFAAISISSLLIVAIFSTYNYYNNALERKILFNDMQMTSFAAVDYLVKSPGQPYNWETAPSTTERIGLAKRPLILSENKLDEFTKLEYNKQKELLNIIGYDFYFKLTSKDVETSGNYPSDADYVVNAQRVVMYKNSTAKVELRLWK